MANSNKNNGNSNDQAKDLNTSSNEPARTSGYHRFSHLEHSSFPNHDLHAPYASAFLNQGAENDLFRQPSPPRLAPWDDPEHSWRYLGSNLVYTGDCFVRAPRPGPKLVPKSAPPSQGLFDVRTGSSRPVLDFSRPLRQPIKPSAPPPGLLDPTLYYSSVASGFNRGSYPVSAPQTRPAPVPGPQVHKPAPPPGHGYIAAPTAPLVPSHHQPSQLGPKRPLTSGHPAQCPGHSLNKEAPSTEPGYRPVEPAQSVLPHARSKTLGPLHPPTPALATTPTSTRALARLPIPDNQIAPPLVPTPAINQTTPPTQTLCSTPTPATNHLSPLPPSPTPSQPAPTPTSPLTPTTKPSVPLAWTDAQILKLYEWKVIKKKGKAIILAQFPGLNADTLAAAWATHRAQGKRLFHAGRREGRGRTIG